MEKLSLQTICDGILRVRDNARELLDEAKLLRENNRISRSYTLAYLSCEETGKLSILLGAATKTILDITVDWKKTRKRFHSHESKAGQSFGLAKSIPIIFEAAAAGQRSIDLDDILIKAAAGILVGPALFEHRNSSMYCNLTEGAFTSPREQINESMADQMIEFASNHVTAANAILGDSIEETIDKIRSRTSRDRYEAGMVRAKEAAEALYSSLRKVE